MGKLRLSEGKEANVCSVGFILFAGLRSASLAPFYRGGTGDWRNEVLFASCPGKPLIWPEMARI